MAEVYEITPRERERESFYTVESLAKLIDMSDRWVRGKVESGEIPSYRFGRARRIAPADVDSFLARHRESRRAA